MTDVKRVEDGLMQRYIDMGDKTYAKAVAVVYGGGSGGGTTAATTTSVVTLYSVTTAFPGADVNDTLSETTILNISSGEIQSTIWTNVTKDTPLASVPLGANISQQASNPLTNAQLRASPVPVLISNATPDVEFLVTTYKATAAATGYAVNDLLQQIDAFSTSSSAAPAWIATTWRNVTQKTTLSSAPATGNLTPLSQTASAITMAAATDGTQRTKITDGSNNASLLDGGAGAIGLVVSSGPAVFLSSANNSTATQLAAAATFTGVIETCFSQPAIQVNLVADQLMTLTVNQYIDAAGLKKSGTSSWIIAAGAGFDMCLPVAGNYFNVTLKNNGSATTTTLQLDTTFGTMAPVDTFGNQPVSIGNQVHGASNAVHVGGTSQVQVVPTVTSASAYAAGNIVGGLLTFANAVQGTVLSGVLESVTLAIKSTQTASFKLYLLSAAPATTFTDKTAPAIGTLDAAKLLDVVTLSGADSGLGANTTLYVADNIGKSLVLAGTSLFGVLVTTGTPTFTTTSDVIVTVSVLKD
ncbi:hypothetical protein B9Z51_08700 [Limnohabitans sp. T6-5]|uniref:hypothetical protein n=1 Tax=Limnohabitans sp. T6-5 TaxID=1100724 RepID=UPI000D3405ED|nr:hypothetical protein [Limnohabitans sp. T6-5]PUE09002.1 hypothetical protein B9Z51_08700 [Limnohabitans sp. T6-5]